MVALADSMGISNTFNVADIYPYYHSDARLYPDIQPNSRSSFSQVRETDVEACALTFLEAYDRTRCACTRHGRVMGIRIAHNHVLAKDRFCFTFGVPHGHVSFRQGRVPLLSILVNFLAF